MISLRYEVSQKSPSWSSLKCALGDRRGEIDSVLIGQNKSDSILSHVTHFDWSQNIHKFMRQKFAFALLFSHLIKLIASQLMVVPDFYTTTYGSSMDVSITNMLSNDLNADGFPDPTLKFLNLASCDTLDPNLYCASPPQINSTNPNFITIP